MMSSHTTCLHRLLTCTRNASCKNLMQSGLPQRHTICRAECFASVVHLTNSFCVCRLRNVHRPGQDYEEAQGHSRKGRSNPKRQSALDQIRRHCNAAAGGAEQATDSAPAGPLVQRRTATPEGAALSAVQPPNITAAAEHTAALGMNSDSASAAVEVVSLLNDSEPQSEEQGFGPDPPPRARSQRQALLSESDNEGGSASGPEAPPDEVAVGAAPAQHALGEHPSLVLAGVTPQQRRLQSAAALIGEPEPCQSPDSHQVLADPSPGSVLAMSPASLPLPDRENRTPNLMAAPVLSDSSSLQLPAAGKPCPANTDGGAISMHSADAARSPAAPAGSPVACFGSETDLDACYVSPSNGLVMSHHAMKLHREGVSRRKSRH